MTERGHSEAGDWGLPPTACISGSNDSASPSRYRILAAGVLGQPASALARCLVAGDAQLIALRISEVGAIVVLVILGP